MVRSNYLHCLFDQEIMDKRIKDIVKIVKKLNLDDEWSIVGSGISGVALLPLISYLAKTRYTIIRKKSEKSHSGFEVEGYVNFKKYIIIDDFIESGRTIRRIRKSIKDYNLTRDAINEGIILYDDPPDYVIGYDTRFGCWVKTVRK